MQLCFVALHTGKNPEAIALGAACIIAAIQSHPQLAGSINPRLVEGYLDETGNIAEKLAEQILSQKPDLVGFSVYLWNRTVLSTLAQLLHSRLPTINLFAGGPDASADPDRIIAEFGLDFVVVGEGEGPFCTALVRLLEDPNSNLSQIQGIRTPGQTKLPIERSKALAPNQLPSPWLSGGLPLVPGGGVLWELARGCPFSCTFCYESRGERGVRALPINRLEAEFEQFRNAHIQHVFVLDPTFNANRKRSLAMLELFARKGQAMQFTCEVRAEFLDEAQAMAFSKINCSIQIGLQSADPRVLAKVGRSLDRADFEKKIRLLNQYGVIFGLDLIYGLPSDTYQGFRKSLDWALKLQPNHLDVFGLAVLPGTQLADDATGFQLTWDPNAPYLVESQPSFTAQDMAQAARLAAATDVFYNHGRAVPWLLAITKALALKPAQLLQSFADWLESQSLSTVGTIHAEIEQIQLAFLHQQFSEASRHILWPAARDLIVLNGAYARALAEGARTDIDLSYSPEALEDPAVLNLVNFVAQNDTHPVRVRISPQGSRIHCAKIR